MIYTVYIYIYGRASRLRERGERFFPGFSKIQKKYITKFIITLAGLAQYHQY